MNWLITDGCGFLGAFLIKRLMQEGGHDVRVLDNLSTGTREDLTNVSTFNELTAESINNPPKGVELYEKSVNYRNYRTGWCVFGRVTS